MNWLSETLCDWDGKVRVELGPQLIDLPCTDENLSDVVTSPHYRKGARDAKGRVIMGEAQDKYGAVQQGETMTCVDWRAKVAPLVWKVYQMQAVEDSESGEVMNRFVQVGQDEDKDTAVQQAQALADGA